MTTRTRAIFTICSNNYVPMARVLLESARRHHPEAAVYLCLADEKLADAGFYPDFCEVVTADVLAIPDFREFAFRYDVLEFNTAVKPFMFRHLLARGHEQVVYLDPDIEVFAPLEAVFRLLDEGASFVLTPHLTQPAERAAFPDDMGIMRAGVYNLGFLGVGACDEAQSILRWWARRLEHHCVSEPERGIFVDQKFMDLVPGFAERARILRETGYNAAYWNLHQRALSRDGGLWRIDGAPLRFFHFSGIDPANLRRLSKHTEAFRDDEIQAPLKGLMSEYAEQVLDNGHGHVPRATYAYGRFASGTPIPDVVRRMFREQHVCWSGGDPFECYEEYLHLPCSHGATARSGYVTHLMAYLHQREHWLRSNFHLATQQGVEDYLQWFVQHGRDLLKDSRLVDPVALRAGSWTSALDAPAYSERTRSKQTTKTPEVTVIGYLQLAMGVGEAGRQMLRTLSHAGVQAAGLPIRLNALSAQVDHVLDARLVQTSQAPVQIFNVNADQLPAVTEHLSTSVRADAWKTVMPFWELEQFPAPWLKAFDLVHEVWAPTRYVQTMLARKLDKTVLHMPLPLTFEVPPMVERSRFGLPDDTFLFFFSFDFLSFVERKNPMAIVRAFRRAFRSGSDRPRVALVIKTLHSEVHAEKGNALREALRSDPDVILIERTLGRQENLQLIACCDAVVSLHRAEGLGLLVAEAMQLGKPVIATDYSATTELVSKHTGWPVDCSLVPVPEGHYPFHEGQVWAEPDACHAAWQMRQVFQHRDEARRRADVARTMLQDRFGADVCAARLRDRLDALTDAEINRGAVTA
ncbi:glycosyltransferase [Diaphorobacter sp. HDW4A]|uniref:glycosyltransferase n=1 Tax=Diaphorobacter sp. HDW4A TaxID=2714924 RepID=UPI0014081229|nr:glycosyltransferase [Diaphorobacter sp. HDW4A]QIL83148.1 glycosyltransferase [Diaphorobacter sp. HDW4A]